MQIIRTSLMMLAVGSLLLSGDIATAQRPSQDAVVPAGHRAKARRAARRATSPCAPAGSCLPANACDACGTGCGCGPNCHCGSGCGCRHGASCGCGCRNGACGHGGQGCRCAHCLSRLLNRMSPYHTCTYSPDHGWAPPAQRPIWPTPAMYRRHFPAKWNGEDLEIDPHARHPMIYMPTDTTQLGYYYQHTPYWRARRNMIPPVPHPAEWHTPDLGVVFTGWEDDLGYAAHACPAGRIIHENGSVSSPTVVSPPADTPAAAPPSDPVPMMESNPDAPYSPAPETQGDRPSAPPVPPESPAPAPPMEPDASKSAAKLPKLVPVPRQ